MNLQNFPHDVQHCSMRFQSYMYTNEQLVFSSVEVKFYETALKTESFDIVGWNGMAREDTAVYSNDYAEVSLTIQLKRKVEVYIYQVDLYCSSF